jgi:thiamine biosynthesis protein ThiS
MGAIMIRLQINGKPMELPEATPLLDFLHSREIDPRFVVVELNGEIAKRNAFSEVVLNDGDTVEIVQMMGGGA